MRILNNTLDPCDARAKSLVFMILFPILNLRFRVLIPNSLGPAPSEVGSHQHFRKFLADL